MATWTLADIRTKVRQVTGRIVTTELSNNQLDNYINRYYQYTFPAELKLERKHTYYSFLTSANVAFYELPNTDYTNWEPPATVNNLEVLWYQDPGAFLMQNPDQVTSSVAWTGDGSTTLFTTTAQGFPIMPDSIVITDNVEVFEDTNTTWTTSNVNIVGSEGGNATVNYSTGAISVTFNTAPADGQNIYLSYVQFQPGRPTAVLLYNNQFRFYPVPDTAYRFLVKAWAIVTPLTNATDVPDLPEWGPCIAYGASRDIHADFGELDAYAQVTSLYKEQLAYVLKRTNQNLLNTRSAPTF